MKWLRLVGVLFALLVLSGCSTLKPSDDIGWQTSADPLQGWNRGVYKLNDAADRAILRPVAKGYDKVLPTPVKRGVRNFFHNLNEPFNAANNLLQGKFTRSLQSVVRFAINSTVGIGGLFDVAKHGVNIQRAPEDLGQTLAAWGVRPGPYLMLPLLGPSNLRDGVGMLGHWASYYPIGEVTDSNGARIGLSVLDAVDARASLLGADSVLQAQLDPYAFIKSTFEQNRLEAIYDGSPPESEDQYDSDF